MNRFVSFEGIDASGKSTQLRLLAERLTRNGIPALATREPGGAPISEKIRELLLHGGPMHPKTEALLFAAARAEHMEKTIGPALAEGKNVLVDRYIHSSLAYQCLGRGLNPEDVLSINKMAMDGLWPSRVFLMDISPEKAMERKLAAGQALDRMEEDVLDDLHCIREGFLRLAEGDPRISVLDADQSPETLAEMIWGIWKRDDEG